ncbi:MAG TPA: hypothetical protein VF098_12165 [Sphingomicrobium sp.]|jgi:hypothetical protein
MSGSPANIGEDDRVDALRLMEQALELLDRSNAPFDVGAHLDLAICRLREGLGIEPTAWGGLVARGEG